MTNSNSSNLKPGAKLRVTIFHKRYAERDERVMNMLEGRYADSRVRELKPRISIDRLDRTVTARKGALLALYMSGGTIPDRGYFHQRHFDTHAARLDCREFLATARAGIFFVQWA